ncbi:MAG TPA: ABC transporter substrate-binding protein [Caldithrix abyssi]|uniref:ABC transporter substrate-binding protein n=1 Tax=Caldithrix abyssi TaxID=187145 RepID=A0A7V5UFV0_CALAY|nr:ABC transporter substrate-binding protein [Caldithrix abyssi]
MFSVNSCAKKETGPIKVGVLLPLTGSKAKFGEMEKNSFELAMEKINAQRKEKGQRLIQLVYEDDTGKPEVGRAAMEKLINVDKVVMVTGGYSSSVTFTAAAVAQQYRTPFLVNTGSVDKITEPESFNLTTNDGDKFYIYRLNPPVSEYASGLEGLLAEVVKPKSVFIIHENTTFGTKGAKAFQKSADRLGIKVLGVESYSSGTVDFKPLLSNAKKAKPELMYMISYVMDAAQIMKQARELRFTSPKLFVGAGAGYTMPAFKENAGVASERVVSATLWHQVLPIPGAKEFFDDYVKKYGGDGPDYHGAEAYAAAQVVNDVLTRCNGKYDKETIKKALDATDLMTVFGPVKFTSYGKKIHQNKMNTYVVQWIDGELKLVWPKDLANAEFSYPINWAKLWAK